MAKVIIAGDAIVIKSGKKLEQLKTLEKYNPKSLKLFETDEDGNKEQVFEVGTGLYADVGQFGVVFASASKDDEKLAQVTLNVPAGVVDVKAWAADTYGLVITRLNAVEAGIDAALESVELNKAEVMANIEVVG